MNAVLLICRRCNQICGCKEPVEKACGLCTTHDCPLLPAPKRSEGYCEFCAERLEQRLGWTDAQDLMVVNS
jgi:hypothetical protein